jgi:hypothetical protein
VADNAPVVHIGENSPEQVAYKLLKDVANAEGRPFTKEGGSGKTAADRAYILDTYTQCLEAVHGRRGGRMGFGIA